MSPKPKARPAVQWPASTVSDVAVADLIEYAQNARMHSPQQVNQLAESIQRWGWTIPILVDEAGMIIAGHGRVMAARQLGIERVPAMVARGWDDATKRAYVLADNKLALNASWDEALLGVELAELTALGFDTGLTGFSADEIGDLFGTTKKGATDPDDVPELEAPVSVAGDIWTLGPHRVMCGDSTVGAAVLELMAGAKADACWTDPPYNVNYESKAGKIANDHLRDDKFLAFLQDAFLCAFGVLKPGGAIYVAHADTEGLNFRAAFKAAGFKLSGCLVWAKNSLVLGRSDYQWQHEPILYGWKPGASHRWFGGRKQTTLLEAESQVFTKNEDGTLTIRIGEHAVVLSGDNLQLRALNSSVIHCERPKRSSEHPTMKPVDLIVRMLRNSSREGEVVLGLFGGSGSTLIACDMLGRQARLMEMDARYVDVIVRRWQQFTGQKAVHATSGVQFDTKKRST